MLPLSQRKTYFSETLNYKFHRCDYKYEFASTLLADYLESSFGMPKDWKNLHQKHCVDGDWSSIIPRNHSLGYQDGMWPIEIDFIELQMKQKLPKILRDFYRLFGRLGDHGVGNADMVTCPYHYPKSRHNEEFALRLDEITFDGKHIFL